MTRISDTSLDGKTSELFQLDTETLKEARRALSDYVVTTPLLRSKVDPELYFKAENLQATGSFKIRPALNQVINLTQAERRKGIVTSSSGNFAQGAAYAARCFETSAKIVMMRSSNRLKVERTERLGGEVFFCENSFEARQQMVDEIREKEGRAEIHPFDRRAGIVGNATIGAEIVEQCPDVEQVLVPVSGGGLIAGIASALKMLKPAVQICGVQPEGSNATFLSFHEGHPVSIDRAVTMADGLMVTRPGALTFPLIQRDVDNLLLVKEAALLKAVRTLLFEEKLLVEPSAAVTLAAIWGGQVPAAKTVCVLSGGNVSPEVLSEALKT
jgi:threonine dehydratase